MDITHGHPKLMAKGWLYEAVIKAQRHGLEPRGLLFPATGPAPTAPAAVAVRSPVQVVVAALAIPIPRPKVGVAGISAPTALPEAITTPMHVVVPAPRATPIALQKRSPWQMALLTLHHALRMPDGFGDIMDISDVGDIMDICPCPWP